MLKLYVGNLSCWGILLNREKPAVCFRIKQSYTNLTKCVILGQWSVYLEDQWKTILLEN